MVYYRTKTEITKPKSRTGLKVTGNLYVWNRRWMSNVNKWRYEKLLVLASQCLWPGKHETKSESQLDISLSRKLLGQTLRNMYSIMCSGPHLHTHTSSGSTCISWLHQNCRNWPENQLIRVPPNRTALFLNISKLEAIGKELFHSFPGDQIYESWSPICFNYEWAALSSSSHEQKVPNDDLFLF